MDGVKKYIRDYGGSKECLVKRIRVGNGFDLEKNIPDKEFEEIYKNKEYDVIDNELILTIPMKRTEDGSFGYRIIYVFS